MLIPEGERGASVVVAVDGIGPVARTYMEKGGGAFSVYGFTGTSSAQHQALMDKLRTTPQFLAAVLNTDVFLDLNHAEAKAMMLGLLNVKVTIPALASTAPAGSEQCLVGGYCSAHKTDQPHQPKAPAEYTLDELDARYKVAFEDRKEAKRALAAVRIPEVPATAQPAIEAIKSQMEKLRTALGAAQTKAGTTVGRRQALQTELNRFMDPGRFDDDLTEEIEAAQTSLSALETAAVQAPAVITPRALLQATAKALASHEPSNGCIIDSRVPCISYRQQFVDALTEVQAELDALPKPESGPVVSPLTQARERLDRLQKRQAHREATLQAIERDKDRRAKAQAELESLPDTAAVEAEIEALRVRIRKGEELWNNATTYWQAVEANKRMTAVHASATETVAKLEALVEQLGPNGARAEALKSALGRFQDAVNPYVADFGLKIKFSVDPWDVIVNGRSAETYSESEKFRIGIALQMGIAMLSGLKFAIVDRVDQLDAANRAIVSKMLIQAPLDQIVILGTREPSQPLPKIEGAIAYRLGKDEKGKSVVVERVR